VRVRGRKSHSSNEIRRAIVWLARNPVQVVIAEGRSADPAWERLLDALRDLPDPPQLVVASRARPWPARLRSRLQPDLCRIPASQAN
jgi:hypothetical protein